MKIIGILCDGLVSKYGYKHAFQLIKESGFDAVDINLGYYGDRIILLTFIMHLKSA